MGLNIGTGGIGLTLFNNHSRATQSTNQATERLTTGLRINRASDDPAEDLAGPHDLGVRGVGLEVLVDAEAEERARAVERRVEARENGADHHCGKETGEWCR